MKIGEQKIELKYYAPNGCDIRTVYEYTGEGWKLISRGICYHPIPKYPAVTRDLNIVVDKEVSYQQVYDCILKALSKTTVD